MTDILDYKIDSLDIKVFDTTEDDLSQQQQQQQHELSRSTGHYVDIITLINMLTSPSEIDYQIISDFFLTYRSFISQYSLLKILFMKLQWSLTQIDD
ncbi:hypothetical protein WICANDRAFT_91930, partial [Wickerhamomyces anomalus NRRL Y-366-8]